MNIIIPVVATLVSCACFYFVGRNSMKIKVLRILSSEMEAINPANQPKVDKDSTQEELSEALHENGSLTGKLELIEKIFDALW